MNSIGEKIVVVGLGKSGMAAVRFFKKRGHEIFASDSKPLQSGDPVFAELENLGVQSEWGEHTEKVLESNLILVSPGVEPSISILKEARKKKIPIWPEIEAAYRFSPGPIIAITGTNGKSTVAALTGHLLRENGVPARVVGNIGIPLLEEIEQMTPETWAVMEVSSFQLETIVKFRPKIAAIIVITQDHLNRHPSLESYIKAKARILENQTPEDVAILNKEDSVTCSLAERAKGKILWFGKNPIQEGVFVGPGQEVILYRHNESKKILARIQNYPLPGEHNLLNLAASVAICFAAGVPEIKKGIGSFKGLPHRLEFVGSTKGVDFYDDSKGTNPDAVASALRTFKQPVILIAGGYDKNLDFESMVEAAKGKVKALVALAKDNTKILKAFSFLSEDTRIGVSEMGAAVEEALKQSKPGDVVLLSPGCASFDLFHSAEERGEKFQEAVHGLLGFRK